MHRPIGRPLLRSPPVRWTCREGRVAYRCTGTNSKRSIVSKLCFLLRGLAIALIAGLFLGGHASAQSYVVKDGNVKSVIVLQDGAQGLYRHSAEELQKYIGQLTGVRPDIVGPRDVSGRPKDN